MCCYGDGALQMNYMEIVRCKWLFPGNLMSEMRTHSTQRVQTGIVITSSAFLFSQFHIAIVHYINFYGYATEPYCICMYEIETTLMTIKVLMVMKECVVVKYSQTHASLQKITCTPSSPNHHQHTITTSSQHSESL